MRAATSLLTVLPVGAAAAPDGTVMLYAPAVGLLVGFLAAGVLALAAWACGGLVAAAVAVAALALLTRGLHLDGLADLADGLGSRKPAAEALEIMRRSDIGPMGMVTLLFTLLIQVTALARVTDLSRWQGVAALVTAVVTGRLAMTWACRTGVPAARPGGLGALVAGTVRPPAAVALTAAACAAAALAAAFAAFAAFAAAGFARWTLPIAIIAGLAVAAVLQWHAVRRLGGITGDVLGALGEVAATVVLLVAAIR